MKKKVAILVALAVVVAMAMPAMAVDISGEYEVEYDINLEDDEVDWGSEIELEFLYSPADNVTAFVDLEADGRGDILEVNNVWIDVEPVQLPGSSVRAGTFGVAAAQDFLYDGNIARFDNDAGAQFSYAVDNINVSLAHNLDFFDDDKAALFLEASMSDLELGPALTTATVNFFNLDEDVGDRNGFSFALDSSLDMADVNFVFANAEENAFAVGASSDQLAPGLTVGLDIGLADEDFAPEGHDGIFDDFDPEYQGQDVQFDEDLMAIIPSASYSLTDSLTASFSYALYDFDEDDADLDILTLGAEYDLAENTALEVEFEDKSWGDEDVIDNSDTQSLTTTLTVNF
ncbi:hypothetical protein [Fuchsiella alkaliacetigena]|uniref:hypothetical protein n=1 Tax=Fuchsiella alkaliacetigena TaxID=957042 RepID=UPI00200B4D6E|nr:hypothetical protein [Fuchsiella alkaliacetigena]MCK8823597.1 hypothetical protein [Fuchsiella alkaliacetigena]